MPENFTLIRRQLSEKEKYNRAIFYYTFDDFFFEPVYENDEFDEDGNYNYDIEKCMAQLDEVTKKQILNFVKKDVYDEKVTLKCLKCDYEETVPWDIVDETWDREDSPYPISYCQRCDKPHFVPIDIYNQKKKK